ncbi:MAG: manganese efflux pump [Oscillospiraceae bacterium]|nr:manganese efflux pump [Oscillospiraceae bacterium]
MIILLYVLLMAISFAVDAFAVATSTAIATPGFRKRDALKMGTWFGAFQFFMPLAGWLLATSLNQYIVAFDHFIAFGLLAFIGGKMVWGSFDKTCEVGSADLSAKRLCLLAIATSIDAMAGGVSICVDSAAGSFAITASAYIDILLACAVIGIVAFALSYVGGVLGKRLGCLFQKRAELVGGLVLIAIGTKILIEHLTSGT